MNDYVCKLLDKCDSIVSVIAAVTESNLDVQLKFEVNKHLMDFHQFLSNKITYLRKKEGEQNGTNSDNDSQ